MIRATRIDPNNLFYWIEGNGFIDGVWSDLFGRNYASNDHWTIYVRPESRPRDVGVIDMAMSDGPAISTVVTSDYDYVSGNLVYTPQAPVLDLRTSDRVTLDHQGAGPSTPYLLALYGVDFIDAPLNQEVHLEVVTPHGVATDGTLTSITARYGDHNFVFTGAPRDSLIFLGGGYDTIEFADNLDVPGTQYWSLIRRPDGELDAYNLLTGFRVQMAGGFKGWTAAPSALMNYGEVEEISLANSRTGGTDVFLPGVDLPSAGARGTSTNIDLRSDGQLHSDSFNLAYFNFIRYTSDNVWVGEATIHDGTNSAIDTILNYSTPSDRRVASDKNVLLKSGYTYDAPILEGQLSVIGQSRNGTHDLIVAERNAGEAINGHFRLYAFDVESDLYNEFNQVFLGTSAGENPANFASALADTPANRVAMYGFGGNDILTSGAGKDYLFGGRSTFNVTNANNTAIVSNSGNVITGGTGADYFGTGATNSLGQLINGAGAVLGTGLETGAPQGSFIGSTSTGGTDGKGVGLFWVSHATDIITDWEADIDTLVVLENGVAIIGGVRSGATVTDLRGSNTLGTDGNTTINLRATAAVATSDQDFDGARGGDDWDASKDLDYIFANQDDRDDNSITNEASDVTVVNAGLIVARGLGGTDTLLDSPGDDYLYGNRGSNTISLSAGGNDRVYYDTFDGAQARHYVSDFTKSDGAATDRDTFYLNKGVIDAFYGAGSTRALTTANVNGVYTDAIAYAPSINYLHDVFYNPSIVTTNDVHRGQDGRAPSALSGSDGTTFGIGVGMFAAGTALLFVPFMSGVGYALMASGAALGGGSSFINTQPHQNATFAGNVGAYLNVLTESPNSNGEGTLLKPATSVGSSDTGVTFLSFFEGVNAGDGYLPVVEFTSHAGQGIYGYFALHSSAETFVYLVASRDNLVTDSEAIQIAQIEGNLTAADFAIYDGRVDIYNQAVEDPIVIVEPTIVTLGDDTIANVLSLDPKRFDDVDNPLKLTMTVPGNVVGANIKIYDGTSLVFNGTTGTYTSAASGNNPGGNVTMTSSTYNAGTGLTTFVFSDARVLGTRAIQTDTNALNDAANGNQFQLADTVVNYTVAFADPTSGIETYDNTGGVEVAGGNATIDGQAGDDILFVSETSSFLNGASDAQLVSIESIAVTGAANIDLSNQSEGFSISGSGAADTIEGGAGANYIVGGGGNDSLIGGIANDTFVGFTGSDTIAAGSGTDKLVISGTSTDLNSASNARITGIDIVEVEIAEVAPILGLIVEGGVVTGVDVVNPGTGLVDGTYNISLQPASGFGTAAVVSVTVLNGSIVIPTVTGTDKPAPLTPTSGGSGYAVPASDVTVTSIAYSGAGALVDLSNQSDGFQFIGDSYVDTLIGSTGEDTLIGGLGADQINLTADGQDDLVKMSSADGGAFGANTGWDTITGFHADGTFTDLLEVSDWVDRSSGTFIGEGGVTVNDQNLGYLTATTGSGVRAIDETELLIVSNSSVSSISDVKSAIDSAYDLTDLDDGSVLFAVKGADPNEYWFGIYNDVGADDVTALSDFKVLSVVTVTDGAFDFDDFWQPGVLLNLPPEVNARAVENGVLVESNEDGTVNIGGEQVTNPNISAGGQVTIGQQSVVRSGVASVTDTLGATGEALGEAGWLPANTIYGLGTSGNDTFTGNYAWGFAGNDTLNGTSGNDFLSGGSGDDLFNPGAGEDYIYTGGGSETVNLTVDNATDRIFFSTNTAPLISSSGDVVPVGTFYDFSTAAPGSGGDLILMTGAGATRQILTETGTVTNPYDQDDLEAAFSGSYASSIQAILIMQDGADSYIYFWDDAGSGDMTPADDVYLLAIVAGVTDVTSIIDNVGFI